MNNRKPWVTEKRGSSLNKTMRQPHKVGETFPIGEVNMWWELSAVSPVHTFQKEEVIKIKKICSRLCIQDTLVGNMHMNHSSVTNIGLV